MRLSTWAGVIGVAVFIALCCAFVGSDEAQVLGAATRSPLLTGEFTDPSDLLAANEDAAESRQAIDRLGGSQPEPLPFDLEHVNIGAPTPTATHPVLQDRRNLDLTRPSSDGVWTELLGEPCLITWMGPIRTIEYDSGEIASITGFKDGRHQGLDRCWHLNGQLRYRGSWEDNQRVGRWEYFGESGLLREAGEFTDGKREGVWLFFDRSGRENAGRSGWYAKGKRVRDY